MSDDLICTNCGEYAGSHVAYRIANLEAKLGDLGAIKEKAHRQGYEQGKAAGDAFGAAIREHVERLEAERDALQAKLAKAVARAEVADEVLDKAIDASRALIAKMKDRTDDQWRREIRGKANRGQDQ